MKPLALAALGALALAGCVTVNLPDVPPYHPAHEQAETGAVAPSPPVLNLGSVPPTSSPGLPVPGGMTPGMSSGTEGDHGSMQGVHTESDTPPQNAGSMSGMRHGDHEQGANGATPKAEGEASIGKVIYTCPMHPEVTSDKPGKCPKCGMTLVPKQVS